MSERWLAELTLAELRALARAGEEVTAAAMEEFTARLADGRVSVEAGVQLVTIQLRRWRDGT
jgi:hypothetical protein